LFNPNNDELVPVIPELEDAIMILKLPLLIVDSPQAIIEDLVVLLILELLHEAIVAY
jgi:hypothetical protein